MSGKSIPEDIQKSKLKKIWSELLGVPVASIFIDSNFIFLGGDSVLLITLQIRIASELGVDVPPEALYDNLQLGEMERRVVEIARRTRA